jgi:CRISPR-associated protein Cas2|nr:CRISPR-associated endonuclease Cas2 [Butyrivibrio sp.]
MDDRRECSKGLFFHVFLIMLQYSVFEIDSSEKILNNIMSDISNRYEKRFSQEDSVIIFILSNSCKTVRYGHAKNEEKDLVMVT